MQDIFSFLTETISAYNNERFLILLFIVSMVYLLYAEKDAKVRAVYLYLVLALVLVFCCPLYVWIGKKIDAEIYYRVFWSLPIGVLVCYGTVRAVAACQKLLAKIVVCVLAVVVICLNGKFVYDDENTFHNQASNAYHIPQIVINVADALRMEKYKPVAVLPAELLPFYRQYSADIYTPYGRNILETRWGFESALYDAMEAEVYDTKEIARLAREDRCVYIVLSGAKQQIGSLEDENFFLQEIVNGYYYIYMDYYSYEVLRNQNLLGESELLSEDK